MPEFVTQPSSNMIAPDYAGLVRFLVEPFLETPESLRVDCEVSRSKAKIWVRLAFDGSDKGRVFGRGGRNIQAIRTVLEGVARSAGYAAHLDIYGGFPNSRDGDGHHDAPERSNSRRSGGRGTPRPRSRNHPA
ncbi:KH domain-containing protein [Leptothermofonsia sichuanensis]|uniref:KH domain-containing protein n=1 Tax=Leptothermofonsia sichuanensis TaxID=2917832 RepID=UPI001CED51A8|nr:KH domain-containing protein [Leptothermofonsia sichuanensis]